MQHYKRYQILLEDWQEEWLKKNKVSFSEAIRQCVSLAIINSLIFTKDRKGAANLHFYAQLKAKSPALAERFSYLDMRGEEAARASAVGRVKETVVWDE